jgi:hypothetical protein
MTLPKIFSVHKPDHGNRAPIAPHNPSASARHSIKSRWVCVNRTHLALDVVADDQHSCGGELRGPRHELIAAAKGCGR